MAKLKMLKPKLAIAKPTRKTATTREVRMTGRRLQAMRLQVWSQDPHCAMCRKLVEYPSGFELDHRVPLFKGGGNEDGNLQVLCVGVNGCHAKKTADDQGYRFKPLIGLDGYPVET